jgi:hypothetical protein
VALLSLVCRPQGNRRLIAGLLVLAAVVGGTWFLLKGGPVGDRAGFMPMSPAPLSIVVLPVGNLSGYPNQDYFAEGITDDLTTVLLAGSNESGSRARQTAPVYFSVTF